MGAYFGVIRRELASKGFSQAFINNLETILTTANSASDTADTATTDLATLQADVTALQTEVDAIEPDAALLAPLASGELPGGSVGQVQYNSNGVFGGFTVSGDGTLDTSSGAFTLATVPVLKGGTGATTASGARTNLGLAIGTDVQAFDSDLSAVAGLSTAGLMVRTGTGTATTRTLTAPAAGITISNGDGVSGNPTLALANDLAALEALSGTNTIYYRSGADTWSAVTFSGLTFSGGVLTASGTSYTADESTLHLSSTTFSIKAGGVGTSELASDAVTYAKMQNVSATSRVLGRKTAGAGDPEECTLSEVLDFIGSAAQGDILFRAASGWQRKAAGTAGQVLQTNGAGADVSWATPTGGSVGAGQHAYEAFGALPLAATFTGVSTSVTSLTDGSMALMVTWTASGSNTFELYKKTAPSTPYDVYVRHRASGIAANDQFGIIIRNSSNGKFVSFTWGYPGYISTQEWTNPTTFSSTIIAAQAPANFPPWFRINNNGTTLTFYISWDGLTWKTWGTRTIATFLGTGDEIGFGIVPQNSGSAWIGSFGTTAPS